MTGEGERGLRAKSGVNARVDVEVDRIEIK